LNENRRLLWAVRCTLGLTVVVAAIVGTRALHTTAMARSVAAVAAPPGCPTVTADNFSGILAVVPGLGITVQSGLPANSLALGSLQWGTTRQATLSSGDREVGKPTISEVTVTRLSDGADPLLFQAATVGGPLEWTLYIYHSVDTTGAPACESIVLSNTVVTGFSTSTGGGQPSESLSLNFTKIVLKHFGSNTTAEFDLAKGIDTG
jgi:type VI secretion system secreted protein Hcp